MKNYPDIAIQIPRIYLPRPGIDPGKWAVIACDQFTSQPEYWNKVEEIVGKEPSTLNLIFPEVYLEEPGGEARIQRIQSHMRQYLDGGVFAAHDHYLIALADLQVVHASSALPQCRLVTGPQEPTRRSS